MSSIKKMVDTNPYDWERFKRFCEEFEIKEMAFSKLMDLAEIDESARKQNEHVLIYKLDYRDSQESYTNDINEWLERGWRVKHVSAENVQHLLYVIFVLQKEEK